MQGALSLDLSDALQCIPPAVHDPRPSLTTKLAFDHMVKLYYQNFHASHPFLLPRRCLNGHLADYIPSYLLSAMCFIGAGYHCDQSVKEIYRASAYSVITEDTPLTGFKVQGMLLMAIVDHAHGNETRAYQTLQTAMKLAIDIGMNRPAFASTFSYGSCVFEESWRRTYWELFVVSGLMTAMGGGNPSDLHDLTLDDLSLPCEEATYSKVEVCLFQLKHTRGIFTNPRSQFHQGRHSNNFRIVGTASHCPFTFLHSHSELKQSASSLRLSL